MDTRSLTIKTFSEGLRNKTFSAREITEEYLKHIEESDGVINAYLEVYKQEALERADAADRAVAEGRSTPLTGVPLAIKDLILIKGHRTTAASKMLEHYIASYDSGVIAKLKEEGVTFLGKTNLDEFAMGASTEQSGFKITKNPHDHERVPGGSSGGSAAAVAADMALAALGTDTFGSIRQPSGFCGTVGLKPTYGAVSRSGVIAMMSSSDQIGPITKTVEDAATLFSCIRGGDPLDATSAHDRYPDNEDLVGAARDATKLIIGIPREYFGEGLEPEVGQAVEETMEVLRKEGFTLRDISLPNTKYVVPCYYTMMPGEVSSNLARFEGVRYGREDVGETESLEAFYAAQRGKGLGTEPKRRILLGTFVLSAGYHDAYYKQAQKVRTLISRDFEEAFRNVDILLTPTSPTLPFRIGERTQDPVAMYLADVFTGAANLAGVPAISVPAQRPEGSLPVGIQFIGKHFRETDILAAGMRYEQATGRV